MILNRYIVKEIALSFFATLLILTLIIIGNTFVRLLSAASAGDLPVDLLTELLLYGSLKNVIRLIPVALLIGMMLAFSRLYRDSEMIALRAAGVAPRHFYRAIAIFTIPLTLFLAFLVLYAAPIVETKNAEVRREIQQRPEAAGIPPGEFVTSGNSNRQYTILAETIDADKTVMERFFVRAKDGDTELVIWAKSAVLFVDTLNGERFLQIRDGYRFEDNTVQQSSIVQFNEHGIRIPLRSFANQDRIQSIGTLELLALGDPASVAEVQWRFSIILSAPLLALLAFPLSYTAPRQGRNSRIAIAILIYGIYANLLITMRGLLEDGNASSWLAMWWVHGALILLSTFLLHRYFGKLR